MTSNAMVFNYLWLIPALPYLGFLILVLIGNRVPRIVTSVIGAGSVGLAMLLTLVIGVTFLSNPPEGHQFIQTLWIWVNAGGFSPAIAFQLDPLSLLMMTVVTFVGFLIHVYSTEFMEDDPGYARFFSYMNLFVGSMLVLVMADNLFLLYLGWEGVGLCSYLLIGFWYKDPKNGRAARKAFVVTRIGDTAMGIGLFLIFTQLGTLTIREVLAAAPTHWAVGSGMAVAVALLLLGGAVGKSGQLPLQVWLPDAMAGPTPVSALIHAATMVTAGVYLIARMHTIFDIAPVAEHIVAIVGAATLLIAGFSALTQRDIKRILAYSTISQIGYMFLALGVGAYAAAMFHFFTHAFFKALLFLSAGAVINALHHEHDIFRMGGMKQAMPVVFWTFLAGAGALAAFPFITSGFYSKDLILWQAWNSELGSPWLWAAGLLGAFVTGIYTFRMVFVTFFWKPKTAMGHKPHSWMTAPLLILAFFAIIAGFVETPRTLGGISLISDFLKPAVPLVQEREGEGSETLFQIIAVVVSLAGIGVAWLFYGREGGIPARIAATPPGKALQQYLLSGMGFDWLYERLFVRPYVWIAQINKSDVVDAIYAGIAAIFRGLSGSFTLSQTGKVRWYVGFVAIGAVVIIGLVMIL